MSSTSFTKRRIIRCVFSVVCCMLLVVSTAFCFMLDGQSKAAKPKTYFVNSIGRVVNIMALVGNCSAVLKHKMSTQIDIRLYSALKQSGMFMLSGSVLIFDPMISAALDDSTLGYGNTAKMLFIAGMIFVILFFVLSMAVALMKPRGFTQVKPAKDID